MDHRSPEDTAGSPASRSDRGEPARPLTGPGLPAGLVSLPLAGEPGYDAAPVLNAANTPNGVSLSWNAVPNAPRYNLYRKTGSGSWTWLAGTTGTSYTDTKVSSGTKYTYRMAVVSADGKTMLSAMGGEKSLTR